MGKDDAGLQEDNDIDIITIRDREEENTQWDKQSPANCIISSYNRWRRSSLIYILLPCKSPTSNIV